MQIKDILSKDVEVVAHDTPIRDVARKMRDRDCGAIPVTDGDKMVGMITDRDIVCRCVAESKNLDDAKAEDVMTPNILYCYEDTDVEEVARNMADNKVRRLPVVNREKRLIGIVSLGDLAARAHKDQETGEAMEEICRNVA